LFRRDLGVALFVLDLSTSQLLVNVVNTKIERNYRERLQKEDEGRGKRERHTAISKSTNFSAKVLIWLLKQNLYSPVSVAVNTKSPCRSF
jgi:hypothetical protein